MKKEEFYYNSNCKTTKIRAVRYIPDGKISAILQIAHGMNEYIDRYDDFARFLCEKGILVTGNDHLGHGYSINSDDDLGYFCDDNGYGVVLKDIYELTCLTKKDYPNLPYFVLGHSMGSFFIRHYVCEYGNEISGAIIMGTAHYDLATLRLGLSTCELFALGKGWRHRSRAVNAMSFGSYNKRINNPKTAKDWLTKDEKIVNKYVNDSKCNYIFTLNGFYNLFKEMMLLHDKNIISKTPKELPLFFVAGEEDPVGNYTNGVNIAINSLRKVGCKNIDMKYYPTDRHEILNELDRNDVYKDMYEWIIKTA